MKKQFYFDNAATTKVDPIVVNEMKKYFLDSYGNASSIHSVGEEARKALDKAREIIARSINVLPKEIIFTSSGTESNNFVVKGLAFTYPEKKHIITTKIEHDCILNACKWLERHQGYKITYLDVDKEGFVDINQLKNSITENTLLVSVIHGNNEMGTIQDLSKIAEICHSKGVFFHSDACQSYTKTFIDVKKQGIDLLTLNSHKIHGPKGVGALYIKSGIKIVPLLHGGGQEFNKRSSTENIPGIVGFSKAVSIAFSAVGKKGVAEMTKLRDYMIKKLLEVPESRLNGARGKDRLCNNINISFAKIEGESIAAMLNLKGICVSTGSACSSKSLDPSHVIMAIESNPERAHGSIRYSISKYTKKSEIDYVISETKKVVEQLRKISPLTKKLPN
ncbi:MAG: aminotransferase class V-fold PLP-dependent enzyme [Candidatus Pacearchaeota archaeon]|jgi:cysteine desulfurase